MSPPIRNAKDELIAAADRGDLDQVCQLLENGVSVNCQASNRPGWTPLFVAVLRNHPSVVRILLAEGAEINGRTGFSQESPMHAAAHSGNKEMAILLKTLGASCDGEDLLGMLPHEAAALSQHIELFQTLKAWYKTEQLDRFRRSLTRKEPMNRFGG
jgi:ankyrin repeat protein